jgi:hypothetical protein
MVTRNNRNLILSIGIVSFSLHLAWEYAQCSPFFIHLSSPPTLLAMIKAALGDVVLTGIAYGVLSTFKKNKYWFISPWRKTEWLLLIITGLILSFAIEYYALNSGRWQYTDNTPMVLEQFSILPILQLILLFPLTFHILKLLFRKSSSYY